MEQKIQKPQESLFSRIIAPILALSVICAAMSFLLAITNEATAPLIAQNTAKAAEEARQLLLPEADGFAELPIATEVEGVTKLWQATNGAGYIIESSGRGYGGAIPTMVAFLEDGTLVGVSFLQNNETPGLGKKLETDPVFAAQFSGLPLEPLAIDDIDKIASSTISSKGALEAINAAMLVFSQEVLNQTIDSVASATEQS